MKYIIATSLIIAGLLQSPFAYQPPDLYRESDHRLMINPRNLVSDTDTFLKIRPLLWDKEHSSVTYIGIRGDEAYFQVGPYVVQGGGPDPRTNPYRVDYGMLGVFTLAETQKLIEEVRTLKAEMQALKASSGRPARTR